MSRCVCCNALYEYTLNTDICGVCAEAIRDAVKGGVLRKDYVLHKAKNGLTPMKQSESE